MAKNFKTYIDQFDKKVKKEPTYGYDANNTDDAMGVPSKPNQLKSYWPYVLDKDGQIVYLTKAGFQTLEDAYRNIDQRRYYDPMYKDTPSDKFQIEAKYIKDKSTDNYYPYIPLADRKNEK